MMAPIAHSHPAQAFGSAMPWQSSCNKDLPALAPRRRGLGSRRGSSKRQLCAATDNAEPLNLKRRNSKRTVHFAVAQLEEIHSFAKSYDENDKACLWWSRQELAEIDQYNRQLAHEHLHSKGDRLQQVWDDSAKSAARRGSGRRRCSRAIDFAAAASDENDNGQELDLDCNDDNDTLRGLETGLIGYSIHQSRKSMREGIVNAQRDCQQTHPTMKIRILSRTAAHLSRVSVQFAQTMAQADAKAAQ